MRETVGTSSTRGASRSAVGRRIVLACSLASALLLFAFSASALALSQRGHVSNGASFGVPAADTPLNRPSGVAVNEASGDIYVVDSGNNRIVRFNAKHEFVSTWGFGVLNGAKELQLCTAAAEKCLPGLAGHSKGQFHGAATIAIDNSTSVSDPSRGDIYVEAVTPYEEEIKGKEIEVEEGTIDKFTPTGEVEGKVEVLAQFKSYKLKGESAEIFEEPYGVAVDSKGQLWVRNEANLIGFTDDVKNKAISFIESEAGGEPKPGFAIDPKAGSHGGFYIAQELSGVNAPTVIARLAVVEEENEKTKEKEQLAIPLTEALDNENSTGVATDLTTGAAYVDHGDHVSAYNTELEPIQSFGAGALTEGTGLAYNAGTEEVLVTDAGTGQVVVFEHEPEGEPRIDELSAAETTATTSTLNALIDPHGSETEYAFRYSTGAVPVQSAACVSPCVQVPATPKKIGSGFGDVAAKETEQKLTGLSPSTVYHFRVFAINKAGGTTHVAEASGGELTFKTLALAPSEVLPDTRQWQLVSPPSKSGAAIQGLTGEGGLSEAAADGTGLTYVTEGAMQGCEGQEPEGTRPPEVSQILAERTATGWCSIDIDTKHTAAEGVTPGEAPEYHAFSSDLSLGLVSAFSNEPLEHPPLSKDATERTPYLRHNTTCAGSPATCFEPFATPANVPEKTAFGTRIKFVGGSADLSHDVVTSTVHLNGETAAPGQNLYVWSAGQFKLINVLPTGLPSSNSALGFANGFTSMIRKAISTNGSRYIWSASVGGAHLYSRNLNQPSSIQLDVAEEGVTQAPGNCTTSPQACEHAIYQEASADGSVVFFTDEQRLTPNAGANQGQPDLYACAIQTNEAGEETGCKLTDLTPAAGGESANVLGSVMGVSDDGSTVYFVANGGLGIAAPGNCIKGQLGTSKQTSEEQPEAQPIGSFCNAYVEQSTGGTWGAPKTVARLSGEDEWDWGPGTVGRLAELVSAVSPSGNFLTIMSDRNLTGYNTRDKLANRNAEEVYLYDASANKTTCASCNPTGARPEGVFDQENSGEGIGLLIDRPLLWTKRWLAANIPSYTKLDLVNAPYRSRVVSDTGRLFFNSAEGLTALDTNGRADVYQFEFAGVGGCTSASETYVENDGGCVSLISSGKAPKESAFIDASLTGQDVFFMSPESLAPIDTDTSYDVYDASICGVEGRPACIVSPAASPPPCQTIATCHPGSTGPPTPGALASEAAVAVSVSPQHEVLDEKAEKPVTKPKPPTRAQKLAKALKSCKKLKKKSKRHSCEAQARKKYGAKKASAKKSAAHVAARRGH